MLGWRGLTGPKFHSFHSTAKTIEFDAEEQSVILKQL